MWTDEISSLLMCFFIVCKDNLVSSRDLFTGGAFECYINLKLTFNINFCFGSVTKKILIQFYFKVTLGNEIPP